MVTGLLSYFVELEQSRRLRAQQPSRFSSPRRTLIPPLSVESAAPETILPIPVASDSDKPNEARRSTLKSYRQP